MIKKGTDVKWRGLVEKFSSYEGTLDSFCKENSISRSQFYYYIKKFEKENNTTFQAISLEKNNTNILTVTNNIKPYVEIKIEIGKAKIFIPANEIALLSNILREFSKTCLI
ncbi:UNVERIFIED_ORG: hypothetical protein B2H98_06525 [Clostridium botulinum]|uniref:IS66 family insertion sequence element accessory protein TnpA n=1 Tax=Clostridium sp. ZBS20 TaxID=2949966 RepID=UPI000A173520|nr:hypothetical protein [Clostridium sp. ZBS20]